MIWIERRSKVYFGCAPGNGIFNARSSDAVINGHYGGDRLIYVARTRNGITPASREALFKRFMGREMVQCPFANLPEAKSGKWGVGLTAAKMEECKWLEPLLVGQFEFLEMTPDGHLRHSRFMGLREDKKGRHVRGQSDS